MTMSIWMVTGEIYLSGELLWRCPTRHRRPSKGLGGRMRLIERGSVLVRRGKARPLVGGVIRDFEHSAEATSRSKDELSSPLYRLTRDYKYLFPLLRPELDKLLEDAPVPFMMQQATKISGVRRRVSSLMQIEG